MSKRGWIILSAVLGAWVLVLMGLGLLAVVVIAGGSRGGPWAEATIQGEGPDRVAIVRISGTIHGGTSEPSLFDDGGAGARDVLSQLRQTSEDDSIRAVILRIDSPGGAVVASDDIAAGVRRLRERKPVVASMGDVAASGGYYVAAQAERILANPGTITGSIGVIAVLPNLEGTAEKLGIRPTVLTAGESKDAGSPFTEFSDSDRALYQRLLDEAHTQFIEAVATGRGMDTEVVRSLADGRPYSGMQAEANGLVDAHGDLEDAYDAALELAGLDRDDATLIELRRGGTFGLSPFGIGSATDEVKRELGIGLGLQYLYLP